VNIAVMFPVAQLYAQDHEIKKAWEGWSKIRICARCGIQFNWLTSFGGWECKQHLGDLRLNDISKNERCYDEYGSTVKKFKFWDCCKQSPITPIRNNMDVVWCQFRKTIPAYDKFIVHNRQTPGCIAVDHSEHVNIVDDGIRIGLTFESKDYSFAPFGGHTMGSHVIYNQIPHTVVEVYYDKTYDLDDENGERVPRIASTDVLWNDRHAMKVGDEPYDWNIHGIPTPVKILKKDNATLTIQILNIGMHLNDISGMIPFMGTDPFSRPGWNFPRDFTYIKNCAPRLY